MRRRDLVTLAAAALCPGAAVAQQSMRRLGVLMAFPENDAASLAGAAGLEQGLSRRGWVSGKNLRIDYRFAAGNPRLFKECAAELVGLRPDVILASTPPAVAAVEEQTRGVPVVFVLILDPVGQGFVRSLARPGGKITGFTSFAAPMIGKWVQLLKEAAPEVMRVAVMFDPDTESTAYGSLVDRAIAPAAQSLGLKTDIALVRSDADIDKAIAAAAREPRGGLICLPDPFNVSHRQRIIASATAHKLPLISVDIFARSGALISYWFDGVALFGQAASYIDRILRGADPADLPVQNPTKFSLIINLRAAKALGLTVPQSLLQRADEVIE